jgi:ligand-binding SRPBCC domain-containing protein
LTFVTVEFEVTTEIAAAVQRVFDLSLDIDAHLASMSDSSERAVAGVTTGQIGLGEEVTWKARHFGVVWTMTSRITELDAPTRFVDEQVRGPFRRFRHEHRFEPEDEVTLMSDLIAFDAPFGPVGRAAEILALGRYIPHLIAERNQYPKQAAERP